MIKSLKQLATQTGLEYSGVDVSINKISINSTDINENTLFVAIVANRDGHGFIDDAIKNGAKAVLVSKKQSNISIPQIICNNTIRALRKLATVHRSELDIPIVALTGSCGKTSVKEMIVALLSDYKIDYTKGNFNNYLGVPMTVLEISKDSDFAVIEAGTSVVGEIKAAAEIIKPDVALITNIGASHLENLKTLNGVMQEKGELLKIVENTGHVVINLDDERIANFADRLNAKIITVSMRNSKADIFLLSYKQTNKGFDINVSILGRQYGYNLDVTGFHNISNSLLAISVLVALGLDSKKFLLNTKNIGNSKGRFSLEQLTDNLIVVDDTYNASAPSVKSAIQDLSDFEGRKVLVISSMRELGDLAAEYHYKMGQWLENASIDNVLLFGNEDDLQNTLVAYNKAKFYSDKQQLKVDLISLLETFSEQSTKLLVKGARSYEMEEIVNFVKKNIG